MELCETREMILAILLVIFIYNFILGASTHKQLSKYISCS